MIEKLKKVELQDKNILEQYLIKCNRILCDFNFVNIFSWRNVFNTQWLFFDNTPVIYNAADDLILMPCSCCVSFDLILRLSDNFKNDGKSGNFALVDIDFVEKNKTEIEKYFKIELDENNADYIYITKKLVELRGKKLQKKKNLVSQFLRNYPNYQILKMTKDDADMCFELAEKWCAQKNCEEWGFNHEKSALAEIFKNYNKLNVDGLLIKLDNNIIAFSLFSRQNDNTYTVHYEKFDNELKGCGQLINWETAKYLEDKCEYINREQDMGIEGLRQAKKSYQPEFLAYTYKLLRI